VRLIFAKRDFFANPTNAFRGDNQANGIKKLAESLQVSETVLIFELSE
jgi:hypothetical protein